MVAVLETPTEGGYRSIRGLLASESPDDDDESESMPIYCAIRGVASEIVGAASAIRSRAYASLEGAGVGECIDLQAATGYLDGRRLDTPGATTPTTTPRAADPSTPSSASDHRRTQTAMKRFEFLSGDIAETLSESETTPIGSWRGRLSYDSADRHDSEHDECETKSRFRTLCDMRHYLCSRQLLVDLSTSAILTLLTCVLNVSMASSVLGKLDPRLVFVLVDQALLGSLVSGWLSTSSRIPWAIPSVDIAFVPLIAQMAEQIWQGVVSSKPQDDETTKPRPWSYSQDGEVSYLMVTEDERHAFVATLVATTSLCFLLVGLALFLIGRWRITRVVNFLPYPVVAGMLSSIGAALIKSGAHVAAFGGWRISTQLGCLWLGLAFAGVAATRLAKGVLKVPAFMVAPSIVLAGFLATRLAILSGVTTAEELRTNGCLFNWSDSMLTKAHGWCVWTDVVSVGGPLAGEPISTLQDTSGINRIIDEQQDPGYATFAATLTSCATGFGTACSDLRQEMTLWRRLLIGLKTFARSVRWELVFGCRGLLLAAVAMGGIKIAMKTASFSALFPELAISTDIEMTKIGLSNIIAAVLGANGQAYSFTSLKLAQQVGASHVGAGVLAAMWSGAAWLCGFGVLRHVPRCIYGALLLELGFDYLETYLVTPLRRRDIMQYEDVATVTVIIAVAVATSLLEAVAVGLILSLVGTATRLAAVPVVIADQSGRLAPSTIDRPPRQRAVLEQQGDSIQLISLGGYLFFGSASELLDAVHVRLASKQQPLKFLIVDTSKCFPFFDATAISTFAQLECLAAYHEFGLALAPLNGQIKTALTPTALFFDTADDAMEHAEDALLQSDHAPMTPFMITPNVVGSIIGRPPLLRLGSASSSVASPRTPPSDSSSSRASRAERLFRDWLAKADDEEHIIAEELFPRVLCALVGVRDYGASEFVYRAGDELDPAVLLVCSGRCRLLSQKNPEERCLRKLCAGGALCIEDYYTTTEGSHAKNRSETLITTISSTLLRLPFAAIEALERDEPIQALAFHKILGAALSRRHA